MLDELSILGQQARSAAQSMALASRAQKDQALLALADSLRSNAEQLIAANQLDLDNARQAGLSTAMLDRLTIDPRLIEAMAQGCIEVAALEDPAGEITDLSYRPSGIQVGKMRVPLGVIGIIYESRPNVTVDASILCLKSGNATILRGGSEAIHSNHAIAACVSQALDS